MRCMSQNKRSLTQKAKVDKAGSGRCELQMAKLHKRFFHN